MTLEMTDVEWPMPKFDDDTYRLFTVEYTDDSGKVVRADDVPVTVDAPAYSFRGSGLVMYWNDLDKQLKSLEIAHGKDLTLSADSGFTVEPHPEVGMPSPISPARSQPPADRRRGRSDGIPPSARPVATAALAQR